MTTTIRHFAWGCGLLLLSGLARADEGIPALLQFAEHYQQQKSAPVPGNASPSQRHHTAPPAPGVDLSLRQDVLARDRQLAQQRIELNALRQALAEARAQKRAIPSPVIPQPAPPAVPDLRLLRQWTAGLRDAWHGSPDAQRTAALLHQAAQNTTQAKQAAAQATQRAAAADLAASTAADALGRLRQSSENELQTLRGALGRSQQQLTEQQTQAAQATADLAALRQRTTWATTPAQLDKEDMRLSYAAGSALGHDILAMISERQGWGVPVVRDDVLAGVVDTVTGHLQLSPEELARLITQADDQATTARQKRVDGQRQRDKAYVTQFTSQKGVKSSPMGYWYRVDYAGKGSLSSDAPIAVVVSEKLTDGTVIQDMDLNHKVLSQPLSAFPPLFRDALGHLGDHGSLTMVVPPALAYGDTGYPPKVPPEATMVYTLRAENGETTDKAAAASDATPAR